MLSASDLSGPCGPEPCFRCLGTSAFLLSFACHDNHDWIEVALGTFWRYQRTRIWVVMEMHYAVRAVYDLKCFELVGVACWR